ncbi:MAG: ImmA/IrrE family metallo-endopeptidase [Magnetospirillum sp.]|nr:ImmA/IrrE family metallo-endopeptidase [Magnetospirillum sp.]
MRLDDGFERFGDIHSFALDLRLVEDPDGDNAAPHASVGSWGEWRLWVNGYNLCLHDLTFDDDQSRSKDAVTWYLAPLLRWVANNWAPLLHEERFPTPTRHHSARDAYLAVLARRSLDSGAFVPWQAWASRHSIRCAAEGGVIPDFFLRRLEDTIEISWGDRVQPGGDAVSFRLETGVAHPPVEAVAEALDRALEWAVLQPALQDRPWFPDFSQAVTSRSGEGSVDRWINWFIDGSAVDDKLSKIYGCIKSEMRVKSSSIFDVMRRNTYLASPSPAVAMFGSLSPNISSKAARRLLEVTASRMADSPIKATIDQFVEPRPVVDRSPWDEGYRLATYFLEDADALPKGNHLDLDALLAGLEVKVDEERLDGDGPRGVALAGEKIQPTILINTDHSANRYSPGRRFTIGHELCHLLHDRNRAKRVTHTSTPWAPQEIEQRANAFAAMLLMPAELIRRTMSEPGDRVTIDAIIGAARQMEVSRTALIRHLANMGEITDATRDRLLDEISERAP